MFGHGTRLWVVSVNRSTHTTMYQVFDRELSQLLDVVLAGDVVDDRDIAERLVRAVGALVHLHTQHPIDADGRCRMCRTPGVQWWPWRKAICTVHAALRYFLRQTSDAVIDSITGLQQPHRVSR